MRIIESWSPNFGERAAGARIDILLMHYTGMPTAADALARLTDEKAQVSAHYLVDENGEIYHLVPEEKRAFHAGVSYWAGITDVNSHSIGIEIVNPGHDWGYRDFPQGQIAAVIALSQRILARHPIPASRVLAHSDVAPERKQDPGERFPWAHLAQHGVGLWCEGLPPEDLGAADADALVEALCAIGYRRPQDEAQARAVVTAFQRHWLPQAIGAADEGAASKRTLTIAAEVAAKVRKAGRHV